MPLMVSTDRHVGRDLPLTVYSQMEIAKGKDVVERDWPHVVRSTYVLFQSPNTQSTSPEV
jgi:hypothetical protein